MKSEASNNISPKIFIDTQLLLKSTVYSPLKKRIDSSTRRISRWHGEVSKGVGNAGLTTGIIGTALGALNSGVLPNVLGGMFGGILFD